MFENTTQEVYEAWLTPCGKIMALVSKDFFDEHAFPKIKSLLEFKQPIKNRIKGLELIGNTVLQMTETQIMENFSAIIEKLCHDVNWSLRQ